MQHTMSTGSAEKKQKTDDSSTSGCEFMDTWLAAQGRVPPHDCSVHITTSTCMPPINRDKIFWGMQGGVVYGALWTIELSVGGVALSAEPLEVNTRFEMALHLPQDQCDALGRSVVMDGLERGAPKIGNSPDAVLVNVSCSNLLLQKWGRDKLIWAFPPSGNTTNRKQTLKVYNIGPLTIVITYVVPAVSSVSAAIFLFMQGHLLHVFDASVVSLPRVAIITAGGEPVFRCDLRVLRDGTPLAAYSPDGVLQVRETVKLAWDSSTQPRHV